MMRVKDTKSFREALKSDIAAAENWLNSIRQDRASYPQYDDRIIDHRERELFQAFCEAGSERGRSQLEKAENWKGAKRVVEATVAPTSKDGRMKRLEELSELPYDQI